MSSYQTRITATFLKHCSPHAAYKWLSTNLVSQKDFNYFFSEVGRERTLLERLLMRRRHLLIDLGLAQFGCAPRTLTTVFARGDKGVRCAVLANPLLFDCLSPAVNLEEVVSRGARQELEAFALNASHPNSIFSSMINRTECFSELDERNYKYLLSRLGDNPRLATPYDDTFLDAMDDYNYHEVFTDAWELTMTVPTTQEWAHTLCNLLSNAEPPVGIKNIEQLIERWSIDPLKKNDDTYYTPGYGFYLRSRLADLLDADERLLNSPDLALRLSFYRRFTSWRFKIWPEYLAKDGEEFVQAAIQNLGLWKSLEGREKLQKLVWDCPDPNHDMTMPNMYRAYEKKFMKEHPHWFYEKDEECSENPNAITERMEALLASVSEKLDTLAAKLDQPPKKWWR
jgi:hypothetical protein